MFTLVLSIALGVGFSSVSMAEVLLKASHQWPGGKGDIRDEMVQMIATQVAADNVGVKIQVYPGKSLYKPKEQWGAIVKGKLDITAFPLAYAAGRHPEFNLTLMPGLVKNHEHAQRLDKSAFMDRIKAIMDKAGVIVLADTWLAGGFVSKKKCVLDPSDVKGQTFRAAGKAFNEMVAGAGASITSMPSSEIYSGLQTGVLDGANTSSASLVSYRIYEQVTCLTAPGENALWFMYEPILMSKKSFNRLNKAQQQAILAAGKKAEQFAYEGAKKADETLVKTYKDHGVKVVTMNAEQFKAWQEIAK
ncbi:MAG: TRAP transporter substrate-binding protein DctP, partial [Proteobacteria bacterium]|nr:TRAP transporter substrate-binding protein DctP [Pseudomonadota bacterium]